MEDESETAGPTTEQSVSQWLDLEYVTKIIRKYTNNSLLEVNSFNIGPLTTKGENYFSALYQLHLRYTEEIGGDDIRERSFVLKTRLENELMAQLEDDFDVFVREAQYYTVICEETQKLLGTDEPVFGPRAIYVDERIIVMENLKLRGYSIRDVKQGLNLNECHLVLEKLANFHAVSMVLYKKNPDWFRFHLPSNISENPTPLHMMYETCIKSTIEYCKSHGELEEYVVKLEVFSSTIIAKLINVYSRNLNDRFHVLNHGDAWVNNLMFHEQDSKVLFIDFQEGFFGSPGIDLNYLIFTSWQPDVFQHHFEDLILVYHASLCTALNKLNYQQRIPTLDDVKKEISNKGFHGLATTTCLLPILINEHPDLADPENFVLESEEANESRRKIFCNSKYGERLKMFLKYFTDINVL